MPNRKLTHRPLMAGTRIVSAAQRENPTPDIISAGTFTGFATKNGTTQKVSTPACMSWPDSTILHASPITFAATRRCIRAIQSRALGRISASVHERLTPIELLYYSFFEG